MESQLSRINCQMFSTGLRSGHFGGSGRRLMFAGTTSLSDKCHPAWSSMSTACATGATQAAISALQGARKHQETEAFRASYAARAGIEGTHAQAIHRCGLRRSRYTGLAKTHLQHVITAVAINLVHVAEWFAGISVARTRVSRFAALQPAA